MAPAIDTLYVLRAPTAIPYPEITPLKNASAAFVPSPGRGEDDEANTGESGNRQGFR